MTFNEEEYEDILVEEGLQIERGMVFLMDTCHCFFFFHRNISGKRLPREGCFALGVDKVDETHRDLQRKGG